jgi:hypothetical protein
VTHEQDLLGGLGGGAPQEIDPDERDSMRVLQCAGYEALADTVLVREDGSQVVRDGKPVIGRRFLSICRKDAWPLLEPMVVVIESEPESHEAAEQKVLLQYSIGPWLGIEMSPEATS